MTAAPTYAGRLAPAPTGALHLGNARTFFLAWLRARLASGKLILRLEDLDHPKVKSQAAEQAYKDLAWLGLDWDEGPSGSFPPYKQASSGDPLVQSQRLDVYEHILDTLRAGGFLYPCVCTRKEMDSLQSAPNAGEDLLERRYPGMCRDRFHSFAEAQAHSGTEPVWRFRVDDGAVSVFVDGFCGEQVSVLSEWSGDFPVARGTRAGYQLAVVVDDHAENITEVVRGDDLLPSTHRQLALYKALGWEPPAFFHVPLVVGPDGKRLAKRHGDTRLSVLRERGDGPERVLGWLAHSCGWLEQLQPLGLDELVSLATIATLPKERVTVGPDTIAWLGW